MKLGVVSLTGRSSTRIAEEGKKYFGDSDVLDIRKLEVHAESQKLNVHYDKKILSGYDCLYIRGSYKYVLLQRSIARALYQEIYMPIKPIAFELGHNKFLTLLELQKNGIRIPKTYFAPNSKMAKQILDEVNYPIIMKIPYGTQGKGVMFADSKSSASSMIDALEFFKQPYIIQEYIETNATDIRAIVIGNKVIAMRRRATLDELRANIHMGGIGTAVELDPDVEQLAIKSAKAIGAEICAVDILEGTKHAVIEVNLSPGLDGISKATKRNVAGIIAKYLYERTIEFKASRGDKDLKKEIKALNLNHKTKQIMTSLDIKNGMIRLPKFVTDISEFNIDDDVVINIGKRSIEIKEYKIKKEED